MRATQRGGSIALSRQRVQAAADECANQRRRDRGRQGDAVSLLASQNLDPLELGCNRVNAYEDHQQYCEDQGAPGAGPEEGYPQQLDIAAAHQSLAVII